MERAEIQERVAQFPRWHYEFDLDGVRTPIFYDNFRNRHDQRKAHFFDPLVQLCGGTLEGKRVLDLGSNAGYWALCAIESGCEFVLGVDARPMHVEQANFVFEVKRVPPERYRFIVANVFEADLRAEKPFDVVLCLGLLYHVAKPVSLLELIAASNSDVLVIDTEVSRLPGSGFELARESTDRAPSAADRELVMLPTKQAVLDLASEFGYAAAVLKPRFTSYRGCWDYRIGARRAFICTKSTPLDALPATREVDRRVAWPAELGVWLAWRFAKRRRRWRARREPVVPTQR
jgi:SAM-dependent methyltransferase